MTLGFGSCRGRDVLCNLMKKTGETAIWGMEWEQIKSSVWMVRCEMSADIQASKLRC